MAGLTPYQRKLLAFLSVATFFEGYELGERNKARELAEALDFLTPDEERALYQFLDVVRGRFDRGAVTRTGLASGET